MIELLMDPSVWVALLTLVLLEIVLGIDNLVFIAILADKLPPEQRDNARRIGLALALVMRLGLLSVVSWLVTLTTPLFHIGDMPFSGRNLILLLGGLFLLFKATTELHERLEGVSSHSSGPAVYASFASVVVQIVVLDAVFSLDAVITAVGMVDQLPVMMAAVVISIGIMLVASKPLTEFVNAHPTVVVLCLAFLLMIGFSLVAEGFGWKVPKGYIYAAIGFSVMIEFFNQLSSRNAARHEQRLPFRERTARKVLALLGTAHDSSAPEAGRARLSAAAEGFAQEERHMVSGVLTLGDRSVRSIMTPRPEIVWIDNQLPTAQLLDTLQQGVRTVYPVCDGDLENIVGVGRAKDLLRDLTQHGALQPDTLREPLYIQEHANVIRLIDTLRRSRNHLAIVTDEYGDVVGLVTPMDVLEAIAGNLPEDNEALDIEEVAPGHWSVQGGADIHQLAQMLELEALLPTDEDYSTAAGFVLNRLGSLPQAGEWVDEGPWRFTVVDADAKSLRSLSVTPVPPATPPLPA
ncbi:TerC family protein [Isoalcanivorax beigongshangi]|uniref:TerC family protein n=1 Tax=Isoalcanivorax beigongshangi TaxID=3238810 RepID=A0ABV4AF29_9GAMM